MNREQENEFERICKKVKYINQTKVSILQPAKEDLLKSQEHHQDLDDELNDIRKAGLLFILISNNFVFFYVPTISPH